MHFGSIVRRACQTACTICGLMLVLAAVAGTAYGVPRAPSVPEIDPGSVVSALTLMSGGLLVLQARMSSRRDNKG